MLQLAPLPPGLTIQNYYAPLHIIAPNNGTFTFGPATFRNPDGTLMDFTTATGKMQVRRKELEQRLAEARGAETHWTTQRIALEGMLSELRYWHMYHGAAT